MGRSTVVSRTAGSADRKRGPCWAAAPSDVEQRRSILEKSGGAGRCGLPALFFPSLVSLWGIMRIEAFSEGKNLDDPAANEDQLLILPGRGYAVIDGVTDRTGHRYEGMLAGRLAGLLVRDATAGFLLEPASRGLDPNALVAHVTAAIQAAYTRFGTAEEALARPARCFGATLALAADLGETLRFVLVGDSGVRLNGEELIVIDPGLDKITAGIRLAAWQKLEAQGAARDDCLRVSRSCVFNGLARLQPDMRPWLDDRGLADLRDTCLAEARRQFPDIPQADLEPLIEGGIIDGQGRFQNTTQSPLGYCVLDGFAVPMPLVRAFDRPKSSIRSLELFTDGYFVHGANPTIDAWEAAFAEVERTDPDKRHAYPSVKGSIGRVRADDRTVVIVRY